MHVYKAGFKNQEYNPVVNKSMNLVDSHTLSGLIYLSHNNIETSLTGLF